MTAARRPQAEPSVGHAHGAVLAHDAAVDAVAQRVAELVAPRVVAAILQATGVGDAREGHGAAAELVDAATVARALGMTRSYVYEHADQLGVVRVGEGPRPRLRFDLERARAATARSAGKGSARPNLPVATGDPSSSGKRRRRRLPAGLPETGGVLRVGGSGGRGGPRLDGRERAA